MMMTQIRLVRKATEVESTSTLDALPPISWAITTDFLLGNLVAQPARTLASSGLPRFTRTPFLWFFRIQDVGFKCAMLTSILFLFIWGPSSGLRFE